MPRKSSIAWPTQLQPAGHEHSRPQRPFGSEERFDPGRRLIGRLQLLAGDGNRVELLRQHLPDGSIYRDSMPGGQARAAWEAPRASLNSAAVGLRQSPSGNGRIARTSNASRAFLSCSSIVAIWLSISRSVVVWNWRSMSCAGEPELGIVYPRRDGRVYVEPAAAGNLRRGDGHGIFHCRVQASASSTLRADQFGNRSSTSETPRFRQTLEPPFRQKRFNKLVDLRFNRSPRGGSAANSSEPARSPGRAPALSSGLAREMGLPRVRLGLGVDHCRSTLRATFAAVRATTSASATL